MLQILQDPALNNSLRCPEPPLASMEVDIDQFFREYRPMIQKQMNFQTDEQWQVGSLIAACSIKASASVILDSVCSFS